MKKLVLALCAMGAATLATPAMAADTVVNVPVAGSLGGCDQLPLDTTPAAQACAGYFQGNILNQNNASLIGAALTALGGTFNGQFSDYLSFSPLNGATDLSSQFGILTGIQYIGLHTGNGGTGGQNPNPAALGDVTAFYRIDFGDGGTLSLNVPASSNVTLFTAPRPAVPEPATWAMMLLGFGAIGMASRRSRKPVLAQIA